jgi:hypothetical protein
VSLKLGIREIAYLFLISSSSWRGGVIKKGSYQGMAFSHAFSFSAIAVVTAEPNQQNPFASSRYASAVNHPQKSRILILL